MLSVANALSRAAGIVAKRRSHPTYISEEIAMSDDSRNLFTPAFLDGQEFVFRRICDAASNSAEFRRLVPRSR